MIAVTTIIVVAAMITTLDHIKGVSAHSHLSIFALYCMYLHKIKHCHLHLIVTHAVLYELSQMSGCVAD